MDCDICRWSADDHQKYPTHFDHAVWRRNMLAISLAETYVAAGRVDDWLYNGFRDAARHVEDLNRVGPGTQRHSLGGQS